ncbi:MAG TPA: sugar transferase [Acidimicrobiales bacterium]|nr:sugar transferase [Acidimicrobiales bacterium]
MIVKRTIDVTVSAVVLAVAAVPMAVLAVAIRLTMGSPVLFRQERPGRDEAVFTLLKFRTMRDPRPGEDALATDAERLTGLGRWLRRTSLDELPTLWNVLRGDMSLVGPRPLLVAYLDRYSPTQRRRHEVKPGVTGLAQVEGRNDLTWEQQFELDVWYVDHRSLRLDLSILARTVTAVFSGRGVSQEGRATRDEFLG